MKKGGEDKRDVEKRAEGWKSARHAGVDAQTPAESAPGAFSAPFTPRALVVHGRAAPFRA